MGAWAWALSLPCWYVIICLGLQVLYLQLLAPILGLAFYLYSSMALKPKNKPISPSWHQENGLLPTVLLSRELALMLTQEKPRQSFRKTVLTTKLQAKKCGFLMQVLPTYLLFLPGLRTIKILRVFLFPLKKIMGLNWERKSIN